MNKFLQQWGLVLVAFSLTACGRSPRSTYGEAPNLESWIVAEKKKTGPDIDPMPTIQQSEEFKYSAQILRSPFSPAPPDHSSVRPDSNRTKELLEQYALDSFKMVGTIGSGNNLVGLVQSSDKVVYRVKVGNYLGQSNGRISSVSQDRIDLIEIAPNGSGGWEEKPASIVLDGQ